MVYKYIPKREASKIIYLALSIDPEGDSCFSTYQMS